MKRSENNTEGREVSREISRLYLAKCREADRYRRLAADWMRKYLKEERKHWKWKRKYKHLNNFDTAQSAKLAVENMQLEDEIARYKALMEDDKK